MAIDQDFESPNSVENRACQQERETALDGSAGRYVDLAMGAREQGLDELADWLETLARAERSRYSRWRKAPR